MDLTKFQEIWDYFLAFLDRTFQWLLYVFGVADEWPPADYPNINEENTETAGE